MSDFAACYELLDRIGAGTSAETFRAKNRSSGQLVCVKRLHAERLEEWQQVDAFRREVGVLRALSHPSIPALLDAYEEEGEDGRPDFVLVQGFVDGSSLRDRIDTGPRLSATELRDVVLLLLDTLDYLHSRTPPVFHRDIKPSNIVVTPAGGIGLVDFGSVCNGWRLVGEGTVVGTAGYMAPEQHLGQAGPRSDIYSVGATVLAALTGKPPSEFDVSSGAPALPSELAATPLGRMVQRTMSLTPASRPSTADIRRALLTDAEATSVDDADKLRPDVVRPRPSRSSAPRPSRPAPVAPSPPVPSTPVPTTPLGRLVDVRAHLDTAPRDGKRYASLFKSSRGSPPAPWLVAMPFLGGGIALLEAAQYVAGGLAMVGGVVATLAVQSARSYAAATRIARHGVALDATLADTSRGRSLVTARYTYDHRGERYGGAGTLSLAFADVAQVGVVVTVLVDPQNPAISRLVYIDEQGDLAAAQVRGTAQ